MHHRDEVALSALAAAIDQILPKDHDATAMSAAVKDDLVTRIYSAAHTGLVYDQNAFSSNRRQFSEMLKQAEAALGDLRRPVPGFQLVTHAGDRLVRCREGVEIRVPMAVPLEEEAGVLTLLLTGLAAPLGVRWLQWNPEEPIPGGAPAGRIYLNARPAHSLDVWCDVVRALEGSPAMLKIGGSAQMLTRRDCIVVYCARDGLASAISSIISLDLESRLGSTVPGFSVEMVPGIGVALERPLTSVTGLASSIGYEWSLLIVEAWLAGGRAALGAVYEELARVWGACRSVVDIAHVRHEVA
jgi:hypothetical protein